MMNGSGCMSWEADAGWAEALEKDAAKFDERASVNGMVANLDLGETLTSDGVDDENGMVENLDLGEVVTLDGEDDEAEYEEPTF